MDLWTYGLHLTSPPCRYACPRVQELCYCGFIRQLLEQSESYVVIRGKCAKFEASIFRAKFDEAGALQGHENKVQRQNPQVKMKPEAA